MACSYSKTGKFGRLECTLVQKENEQKTEGEKITSPVCPFQRYCNKKMIWENTSSMSNCGRRK